MKTFKVTINGKSYLVEVGDLSSSPVPVRVDGELFNVEVESGEAVVAAAPPEVAAEEVIAPLPGTIVKVKVGVGDRVEYGQELCTLEAMKMEHEIKASRAGVVVAVNVTEGQEVSYGEVMFVLR
ncbi:MAG TPA: biotin/lipoyl-binding protein [Anaerolineae bacterium]|nr:biotin/lipoyl-binding protein [Anaerolineae bacterium]